ncbi:hypothetical protein C8Q78DRAFT_974033 [Trametes maxima]|nr:hypothetical protein C8Q78DRAFT_974033 [Trametes maxima]
MLPRLLPAPRLALVRRASRRASPWPEPQGSQDKQPKLRKWLSPVSRISNFVIVPTVILYAVFVADFGDHEHVFQPPRRWLEAQTAAFFSLSPEEEKLAGLKRDSPEISDHGSGATNSWCVFAVTPSSHSVLRTHHIPDCLSLLWNCYQVLAQLPISTCHPAALLKF